MDWSQKEPSWDNSKIVYVLENVHEDFPLDDVLDAISAVLNNCTIRFSRLGMHEPISIEQANRHSGGYHQSYFKR